MNRFQVAQLRSGRTLRLPLSPVKAEMALQALQNWREPEEPGAEKRWYKISSKAGDGPTQVNIFDEISWWGISAQDFVDEIGGIKGDLEVHINSPGGDAFDGITIYNALAARQGVTTVVDGLAASAASVIAQAGSVRTMSPGAMMMIHDAWAMCIGPESEMLETAKVLGKLSDNIASVYAAHSSVPAAEFRAVMRNDCWYTGQEAVDAGLADRLGGRDASNDADLAAGFDRSFFAKWHGEAAAAAPAESTGGGSAGNQMDPEYLAALQEVLAL